MKKSKKEALFTALSLIAVGILFVIFKSEIITDLLKVLGCGVEANSKHNKDFNTFELENLRWNKIIICILILYSATSLTLSYEF